MRDNSYKIYISDVLKSLLEATGKCKVLYRWNDLFEPPVEADTRTTEEVTNDIIAGLEKILGKEEETE